MAPGFPSSSHLIGGLAGCRIGWRPYSYDRRVPSTRLRSYLPTAALRRAGVDAVVVPPDGRGRFDCVVFQKAYGDGDLELARRLGGQGVKTVFDLCDDHFFNPDQLPELTERGERLRRMLDLVDAVTVSVPGLAAVVGREPVYVVDDAMERLAGTGLAKRWGRVARAARRDGPIRLVWFGHWGTDSPESGLVHLGRVVPELELLHASRAVRLRVITDSRAVFERYLGGAAFPVEYVEWSRRSFVRKFVGNDVCIIPIEVNPYTVHKTNNRVRTSLLLGVPVVATRIPSYDEFAEWVRFGDWGENIRAYAESPELARRDVGASQSYIEATYTRAHLVGQWATALSNVLASR